MDQSRSQSPKGNSPQIPKQVQIGNSPVYRIERKLGKGFLRQVYVGRAIRPTSSDQTGVEAAEVAIKFEHKDYKGHEGSILNEWKVYEDLGKRHDIPLPQMHYKGQLGDYYVTVMDLLGPSLLDPLVINWGKYIFRLPLKAIACIAVEAISILQKLHSRGYIHGDIKPDNMLLGSPGTPEEKKLFLTGLGSATRWRDRSTDSHIKYDQTLDEFRGTIPFASVHTQLGRTSSRRDDLESLVYVLVYLIRGHLPWQRHQGEDKAFLVCEEKMATPPFTLCGTCPEPYLQFTTFVLNLRFDELPAYARYISLFHESIGKNAYVWPLRTGVSQEVLRKRARLNDEEDPLKLRMGLKLTQWISVYDMQPPTMRQRYLSNLDYADLLLHIEKGHEEGMYITSVAYSSRSKSWAVVMDDSIGYTAQTYTFSCGSLPKEWITKKWSEDFYITALAGADEGRFLVIMSTGLRKVRQAYRVTRPFPFDWIKKMWAEGFRVTAMATSWRKMWAVIVSKGTEFTDQAVELDLQYPAEGIRQRWNQGYYVTSVAATPDQVAFIFSKIGGGPATAGAKQEMLLTFDFPSDSKIEEKQAREYYISSLCYGRTIA